MFNRIIIRFNGEKKDNFEEQMKGIFNYQINIQILWSG